MKTPYLIQRGKFKNDFDPSKGIDGLIRFDYMGSAEFEWGALPESLERIRADKDAYLQFEYSFENFADKPIMVLCKQSQKEELPEILGMLADKELRLKEYCDLDAYLKANRDYRTSDIWWDIENDYFFWRSTPNFNEIFSETLLNYKK